MQYGLKDKAVLACCREIGMPRKRPNEVAVKLPANIDINVDRTRVEEKKVLEFVPNTVRNGEAIIVRIKKYGGLAETCFVVCNKNGKIVVMQVKE